jgi:hypothetical protein
MSDFQKRSYLYKFTSTTKGHKSVAIDAIDISLIYLDRAPSFPLLSRPFSYEPTKSAQQSEPLPAQSLDLHHIHQRAEDYALLHNDEILHSMSKLTLLTKDQSYV